MSPAWIVAPQIPPPRCTRGRDDGAAVWRGATKKIVAAGRERRESGHPPYSVMPQTTDEKRSAFEREALPHLDTVYRVALRFTGEPSRAQDLVQDTMLKAFRSWHRYEPGTNVRAWLLTIL